MYKGGLRGLVLALMRCSMVTTPGVNFLTSVTRESGGLFSVHSTLEYKVTKEDKDANFSCEVRFFVPGAIRTLTSSSVDVTVHCEWSLLYNSRV